MSEVGDAVQILVVSGKCAMILGNLTLKTALQIAKVMNTIYLSKWQGKTSFARFRHIKGDNMEFINLGSEDKQILSGIEKEMKAHGILFAKLPDLCGGDGQTQYVIASTDLGKFKAFLLDHANGKYKDIRAGVITAEDYAKSGFNTRGEMTEELDELVESAKETIRLAIPEKKQEVSAKEGTLLLTGTTEKNMSERIRNRMQDAFMKAFYEWNQSIRPYTVPVRVYQRNQTEDFLMDAIDEIKEHYPDLKRHDLNVQYEDKIQWFKADILEERDGNFLHRMEDGQHVLVIGQEDVAYAAASEANAEVPECSFCIRENKIYHVARLDTGERTMMNGKEILGMMETVKGASWTQESPVKNLVEDTKNITEKAAKVAKR